MVLVALRMLRATMESDVFIDEPVQSILAFLQAAVMTYYKGDGYNLPVAKGYNARCEVAEAVCLVTI